MRSHRDRPTPRAGSVDVPYATVSGGSISRGRGTTLDLIQLNSFGCGLDAVTTDQVEEILSAHNKLYTVLKIDEGSNLGAARIRIRSLKAAIDERKEHEIEHKGEIDNFERVSSLRNRWRKIILLLVPQMAPMQFDLLETAFREGGYNAVVLPAVDKNAVDLGLRYINNDACYPTIVSLGQIISALQIRRLSIRTVRRSSCRRPAADAEQATTSLCSGKL